MDINETDGKEAGWGVHLDVVHGNDVSWKQHMTNEELYGDLPKSLQRSQYTGFNQLGTVSDIQNRLLPNWCFGSLHVVTLAEEERQRTSSLSSRETQTWTA